MIKHSLVIFLSLSCYQCLGQMFDSNEDSLSLESPILQLNRIEFNYETSDIDFHIVPAHEDGILVVQETYERSKDGFVWKVHLVDTALNIVWTENLIVDYGWRYIGYDYNEKDFLLLFSASEYNMEEMIVKKVSYDGQRVVDFNIDTVIPLELTHFEVVGDALIFGGNASGRPAIVYYNLNDRRPIVLPGIYNNKSSIVAIQISDKYQLFSVLISEKTTSNDYTITLKVFSSKGDMIYTSKLETEAEKSLIDAVSTYFKNGEQYVSGTYGTRKSDRSVGFYLAKLKGGEQEFIKYHPYTDLYNFFSYMKDNQKDRVKKKIDRKKIRGKSVKMNYRLLVHEIVRRGNEFILIGEAYYPKYGSVNTGSYFMSYDPFSPTASTDNRNNNFLGYQYTHAVVVGFNEDGEILWDNSFEISDVLLPSLEENIQVNIQKDKIVLLYTFDDTIRSRILSKGDMVEGKAHDPIELKYENDELKEARSEIDGMKEWYGESFYAFGTQRIKNVVDLVDDKNRKVFYINKVTLKN